MRRGHAFMMWEIYGRCVLTLVRKNDASKLVSGMAVP
jgi:hypothetical protein